MPGQPLLAPISSAAHEGQLWAVPGARPGTAPGRPSTHPAEARILQRQGPPPALPPPPAPRPSGQPQAAAVQPRQLTAISTFQQAREESAPQALTCACLEGRGAGYAGTPCLCRLRVQAAPGSAQHKGTRQMAERLWEPGVTVTRRVCEGPAEIVCWLRDPRGVARGPQGKKRAVSPQPGLWLPATRTHGPSPQHVPTLALRVVCPQTSLLNVHYEIFQIEKMSNKSEWFPYIHNFDSTITIFLPNLFSSESWRDVLNHFKLSGRQQDPFTLNTAAGIARKPSFHLLTMPSAHLAKLATMS